MKRDNRLACKSRQHPTPCPPATLNSPPLCPKQPRHITYPLDLHDPSSPLRPNNNHSSPSVLTKLSQHSPPPNGKETRSHTPTPSPWKLTIPANATTLNPRRGQLPTHGNAAAPEHPPDPLDHSSPGCKNVTRRNRHHRQQSSPHMHTHSQPSPRSSTPPTLSSNRNYGLHAAN